MVPYFGLYCPVARIKTEALDRVKREDVLVLDPLYDGLEVRIHLPPAVSQRRIDVRRLASRSARSSCSGGIGPSRYEIS